MNRVSRLVALGCLLLGTLARGGEGSPDMKHVAADAKAVVVMQPAALLKCEAGKQLASLLKPGRTLPDWLTEKAGLPLDDVERLTVVQLEDMLDTAGMVVRALRPFAEVVDCPTCGTAVADMADSQLHLLWLVKAMLAYENDHGCLPPRAVFDKDGKPLLSWRVLLFPYLNEKDLLNKFQLDEPWDGPHNRKLIGRMPATFRSVQARFNKTVLSDGVVLVSPRSPAEAEEDGKLDEATLRGMLI